MDYKAKLQKPANFKSLDELAKAELPRVQWIVWTSRPDALICLVLVDMRETANKELVLVMYEPAQEMFYVAYAPPRYANVIKALEAGVWLAFKTDRQGYVVSVEYAESELTEADLQKMLKEFVKELAKAYQMRQRTWQKVYELYIAEVELEPPFSSPDDALPF